MQKGVLVSFFLVLAVLGTIYYSNIPSISLSPPIGNDKYIFGPSDFLSHAEEQISYGIENPDTWRNPFLGNPDDPDKNKLPGQDDGQLAKKILACGQGECKEFETELKIVKDPLDRDPLWWKNFFEGDDTQKKLNDLITQANAWAEQYECEGSDCEKKVKMEVFLDFIPEKTKDGGECSESTSSQEIKAEATSGGFLGAGACTLAANDAMKDYLKQVQDLVKSKCGRDCAAELTITNPVVNQVENGDKCTVSISSTAVVHCLGGKKTDGSRYIVKMRVKVCVECIAISDGKEKV